MQLPGLGVDTSQPRPQFVKGWANDFDRWIGISLVTD
jgi:hypothetical protein